MKSHFYNFGILAATLGLGCASVPPFQPSQPIDQATSLTEGILLCNEYQMPQPALRPVALKPFVHCIHELDEVFNGAQTQVTFHTFHTEIRKKYKLMEELEWNPQLGMEYEIAIHAIARKISHGDFPYGTFTPREQEFALRYFPKTASLLNARNWKISIPAEFDPELEKLFAGIAALLPRENNLLLQASTPVEPGHDQTQLAKNCEDIRELKENADQLHGLWKDLKIFAHLFAEKAAPAEPQKVPTSFQQTLARYRKLMTDAKEKLKRFRAYPKITCV